MATRNGRKTCSGRNRFRVASTLLMHPKVRAGELARFPVLAKFLSDPFPEFPRLPQLPNCTAPLLC